MTISSDSPTARLYKSILDAHYYQKHNDRFAMTVALQETKTIVKHNPNVIWISVKIADMAQKFHHENIEAEICLQGMFKSLRSLPIAWAAYLGLFQVIQFFINFQNLQQRQRHHQRHHHHHQLQDDSTSTTASITTSTSTTSSISSTYTKICSQPTCHGYLPLHFASHEGHEQTTSLLLTHDPQAAQIQDDLEGELPLHGASFNGHENVVRLLLDIYPKASQIQNRTAGWLALHKAARKGHFNVVKILVENYSMGAFIADHSGNLPLHLAASYCHTDVVRILLEQNPGGAAKWNKKRDIPLHCAMKLCIFDVIQLLLEVYPDGACLRDRNDRLPINYASRNGACAKTFKLILEKSAFAGLFEHRNSCQYLRLWQTESTIFDGILHDFEKEEASYILNAAKDYPILHDAIGAIPLSGIYYILHSIGVDLSMRDVNGKTALSTTIQKASKDNGHYCWEEYYKPVMKLIMNRIKAKTKRSRSMDDTYHYTHLPSTLFMWCSDVVYPEMMDCDGRHALHVAIDLGIPWDGIKLILDVDIRSLSLEDEESGLLPFMMAACSFVSNKNSTTSVECVMEQEDGCDLSTVYGLLLTKPDLLLNLV